MYVAMTKSKSANLSNLPWPTIIHIFGLLDTKCFRTSEIHFWTEGAQGNTKTMKVAVAEATKKWSGRGVEMQLLGSKFNQLYWSFADT